MILLATLTAGHVLTDAGHGVRESFYMFWDTLWALVLGFTLSGAVQAFVARNEMRRSLGDHGPAAVARASVYGMVSSSCSYAASAMARSLFAQGADFLASMVFMFASTNLVVELGIVLVVLIGWQFVAAEVVGGIIMIVLLVTLGSLWFRGQALTEARVAAEGSGAAHDGHDHGGEDPGHAAADVGGASAPWRQRIRSRSGWSDAAGYAMGDVKMLRKEMLIGFVVAGFLAALVPVHLWNDVFINGHGPWTTLENVMVGPLVAIVSFVCSIGNVPLAAALWQGGISFGGVVSFVFADLITLPLLLVYRRQYGRRMTVRMLSGFWLVMSLSGLITQYLFRALGWIPRTRPTVIAGGGVRFDYTSVLDVLALIGFAFLCRLYHRRDRLGGGQGYARDPVCGMQVEVRHAPATWAHDGQNLYFCSQSCRDRFVRSPARRLP